MSHFKQINSREYNWKMKFRNWISNSTISKENMYNNSNYSQKVEQRSLLKLKTNIKSYILNIRISKRNSKNRKKSIPSYETQANQKQWRFSLRAIQSIAPSFPMNPEIVKWASVSNSALTILNVIEKSNNFLFFPISPYSLIFEI